MLELLIQNFELAMMIIAIIAFAELLLLAHILLHKRGKQERKTTISIPDRRKDQRDNIQIKKDDDQGLTIIDLDKDDFDFEFL